MFGMNNAKGTKSVDDKNNILFNFSFSLMNR